MSDTVKGLIAGLIATIVLSILMILKNAMGVMPELSVIEMLSALLGAPATPVIGWLVHVVIGVVAWGILFSVIAEKLPGTYWQRGIIFGLLAWLAMMIVVMPLVGEGLFGLGINSMAPVMTAILHIIYGAALGISYAALKRRQHPEVEASPTEPAPVSAPEDDTESSTGPDDNSEPGR